MYTFGAVLLQATYLKDLKLKEKSAVRTTTLSKYHAHTMLKILPLESLIYFFKLQFMSKYIQGFLPASFNNVWIKRENWRAENFSITLRNSDDFYIPTPLLSQTERNLYFLLPKLWSDFSNNDIKIIRNHVQFNAALTNHSLSEIPITSRAQDYFVISVQLQSIPIV